MSDSNMPGKTAEKNDMAGAGSKTFISMENAEKLRTLLNDNPGLPIYFITKPDESMYGGHGVIEIQSMEKGKILADEDNLDVEAAVTTDEELRLMLAADTTDEEYFADPHGYMKNFAEEANKYKQMWKPALIVEMDVKNADDEESW